MTKIGRLALLLLLSSLVMGTSAIGAAEKLGKKAEKPSDATDATTDPYDGRHVALTVIVSRESLAIEDAAVRPGVAPGLLAGSSPLRVRMMAGRGDLIREVGFPDPLTLRVYNLGPAPSGEPNPKPRGYSPVEPDAPPHTTEEQKEARVTILVPLSPSLAAVSVGWNGGAGSESFDLLDAIERGCAKDEHRACRAWIQSASRSRP